MDLTGKWRAPNGQVIYGNYIDSPEEIEQQEKYGLRFLGYYDRDTGKLYANDPRILSDVLKSEIERKAKLGIPLTNPTEKAQAYYDQVLQQLEDKGITPGSGSGGGFSAWILAGIAFVVFLFISG